MPKYRTNDLNKKIELQKITKTDDGAGGFMTDWESIGYLWAKIELLSNISNRNFDILEIKASHIIVVRKPNNIDNNMRFIYNDNIYSIKYINNLDNYFTEIIVEEL